jgi:hypothetical protein
MSQKCHSIMAQNNKHNNKIISEIADYIYANPDKKMPLVVSHFVTKCHKNKRTIERYIAQAKSYNAERMRRQEHVRSKTLDKAAADDMRRAVFTCMQAEEILSSIARGVVKRVGDRIIMSTASEQVRAIDQLAQMQGWNAPLKTGDGSGRGDSDCKMDKIKNKIARWQQNIPHIIGFGRIAAQYNRCQQSAGIGTRASMILRCTARCVCRAYMMNIRQFADILQN